MAIRKNQAKLSAEEKSRFVAAMLALKASGKYDQYVREHRDTMDGAHHLAHRGPAFLPWHREFLRRFELDLQTAASDPNLGLPYWVWSVDTSPNASIWGPDFLGGNGRPSDGKVMDGPFAFDAGKWTLNIRTSEEPAPHLRREFGRSAFAPSLPTPGHVESALGATPYDVAPWNASSSSGFRNRVEGWISGPQLHNRVHLWVGGSMLPSTSPNDPVFFLNHCFVDKLWADWQAQHPGEGYRPTSGAHAGHNLNDLMQPWNNVRPAEVLDHHALGYSYDTEEPTTIDITGALSLLLE